MTTPTDADGWTAQLCDRLKTGSLVDALALLHAHAAHHGEGQTLSPFVAGAIRAIEAGWQDGRFSDAEVTLAFATARHLIDLWQARDSVEAVAPAPSGPSLLASVVPGDAHTFGTQIMADSMRLAGWRVETLLSARSSADLLARVASTPYGAVLLSVGHDDSLAGLSDLIAEIRLNSVTSGVFVLVGGSSLAHPLTQYKFLGADLVAGTAAEGVAFLASRLMPGLSGKRN